jgi:hypothetical protein
MILQLIIQAWTHETKVRPKNGKKDNMMRTRGLSVPNEVISDIIPLVLPAMWGALLINLPSNLATIP